MKKSVNVEKLENIRISVLRDYLFSIIKDKEKALQILYSTRTFAYLKDIETDFYWKSEEELLYLLQQELQGNMSAWESQAF